MDKLKMAHEYAMELVASPDFTDKMSIAEFVGHCWKYADLMQAEADEREPKGFPDVLLTKKPNGECAHTHTTLNRTECFDCGEVLTPSNSVDLEWQPDWSLAPEWANWWAIDADLETAFWYEFLPVQKSTKWYFSSNNHQDYGLADDAPNFNYQGDWRESLRKRP